ncbi:hypothetical protein BGZ47_010668 [Haplosporangium gracile]|nr:hypothetical protein BGZ47_010668 [Haplosporangium gracile]
MECTSTETCFLYSTGTLCQPFTPPPTYPSPDTNNTLANPNPPGWYFSSQYPSLRYTGSLTNQIQGANCTTIPIPPNPLFTVVASAIRRIDQGGDLFATFIDLGYPTSLMQYRGNCAENFYCQPTAQLPDPSPYKDGKAPLNAHGSLPGTCQPVKAISQPCEASSQCGLWHIAPDGSYNNDQNRCQDPNGSFKGTCVSIGVGKGNIYSDGSSGSYLQQSAKVYLLASLFLFCLMFVYMWYRRQKLRQQQMQYYAQTGLHPSENPALYSRRGGVNRQPDENDGELPSYGMHRRDERVTGPAAEEIGMYSFPSGAPGGPPTPGAGPMYPYPVTHPALTLYPPAPPGTLYPPPQGPPPSSSPALTPQQAEAAALAAAAAAALPAPTPAAASNVRGGGLLPPSYNATAVPTSQPLSLAVSANITGNSATNTASATGAAAGADGEKLRPYNPFLASTESSPRGSFVGAEKSAFGDEQDGEDTTIPDQASASSGSGSGTGPFSTMNTTKPSSNKKESK